MSLVLGSGGARGLAHIGAIQCLEERGFSIDYTAGSSMGALIGGIHAAGKLDVYADWVTQLRKSDIMRLLDFGWGRGGALFKGERIIRVLEELIGEWQIEDLPIGFTAVATDIQRKREVWFNRGPLFFGIRASIAIPTVFAPVVRGREVLLDGAILNPLPIAPTLNQAVDLTVAVDVNGMEEHVLRGTRTERAPTAAETRNPTAEAIRQGISRWFDGLLANDGDEAQEPAPPQAPDHSMFDLALEAMDAMQAALARYRLATYSPDILMQVPRNVCEFFEFHRASELIELGHARMDKTLDEYF